MARGQWSVGVDWAAVSLAGVLVALAVLGLLPSIGW